LPQLELRHDGLLYLSSTGARLAIRPDTRAASTVTTAATSIAVTDGSDSAKAGARASSTRVATSAVTPNATDASTGRRRASTSIIATAAASAPPMISGR